MIESKEFDIKIAENEDEEFWIKQLETEEKSVEILEKSLKLGIAIVAMCRRQIDESTA